MRVIIFKRWRGKGGGRGRREREEEGGEGRRRREGGERGRREGGREAGGKAGKAGRLPPTIASAHTQGAHIHTHTHTRYLPSSASAVTLDVTPDSEFYSLAPGSPPPPPSPPYPPPPLSPPPPPQRYLNNAREHSTHFYCHMSSNGWHALHT